MAKKQIIQAWKDVEYRSSLSDAERSALPDHPSGLIELGEAELERAAGGSVWPATFCCSVACTPGTSHSGPCTQ
jgi:mersacidin/lichenicidin family type 2 lantibiotic